MISGSYRGEPAMWVKNEAGVNRFVMFVGQWINRTNSIGMIVKAGIYGGIYAHKDIAFHFAMWLSPPLVRLYKPCLALQKQKKP